MKASKHDNITKPNQNLTGITPDLAHYASINSIVICDVTKDYLTVAAQQISVEQHQQLEQLSQRSLKVIQFTQREVDVHKNFVSHSYTSTDNSQQTMNFEQLMIMDSADDSTNYSVKKPVVEFMQWLLTYTFKVGASDIHFEPNRNRGIIRMRIDGILQRVYSMPIYSFNLLINRLKILGRMDISEKRRPQDGRIKSTTLSDNVEIELRLATLMTAFGEKLVVRIFCPEALHKSFNAMGFSTVVEKYWKSMLQQTGGIILVTGPTGSGKTTTLYNALDFINSEQINICTVEDPIEMVVDSYNQTQVQNSIDVTFPAAIRALLRQDPDVIMVGEIRDAETADMAMRAALTGHLVLSTLHADSSVQSITRLIDIGVPHYLINSCLLGVLSQRLIRLLCSECKVPDNNYFRAGSGCYHCNYSGYKGRSGVYELMSFIDSENNTPKQSKHLHEMADKFIIQDLSESVNTLLHSGRTSKEEIIRVIGVNCINQ